MFKISFKTDNAAFDGEDLRLEIARILYKIAEDIESSGSDGIITDLNGNRVGTFRLTGHKGR